MLNLRRIVSRKRKAEAPTPELKRISVSFKENDISQTNERKEELKIEIQKCTCTAATNCVSSFLFSQISSRGFLSDG